MAAPIVLPQGTVLQIRLRTEVSSVSHPGAAVEAVTTQPVMAGGQEVIPMGAAVHGVVVDARRKAKPDGRAALQLLFREIVSGGSAVPISATVTAIDNARESVDAEGVIHGLKPMRARPGKVEDVLILAGHAHPVVLATMEAAKLILAHLLKPEIDYRPGVDMTVGLAAPVNMAAPLPAPPRAQVEQLPVSPELSALVAAQPVRTMASNGQPSDMTNLLFAGEEELLRAAFAAAGWLPALAITLKTEAATFFAVCERHAYGEAPVSILLLDGQEPDLVFQKQNNTFAKRHHIRIWRRPESRQGRPVWVGAATHDIGIVFSREARTFTHKVQPDVDLERAKVTEDLCFAGAVAAKALVTRPAAPREFDNATGDRLQTDGAMAVLVLRSLTGQDQPARGPAAAEGGRPTYASGSFTASLARRAP